MDVKSFGGHEYINENVWWSIVFFNIAEKMLPNGLAVKLPREILIFQTNLLRKGLFDA